MLLICSITFVIILSNTFFILFIIDSTNYTQAGFIISITMIVQLFTDYPSGSLGDYIGQKWLLVIANLCYATAYFILSQADTFIHFAIVAVIIGIANAQASGTLGTWLDNNYKSSIGDFDVERKIYGFSLARITTLSRFFSAGGVILGGTLATAISREFTFAIQGLFYLVHNLLILLLVKNVKTEKARKNKNSYMTFVKGGIRCITKDKSIFFFILGFSISTVTWSIWVSLLQKPIYFGYTGLDNLASLLRSLILILGIPIGIWTANISKRLSNRVYPIIVLIHNFLFFPSLIILLTLIPIVNSFSLIGFISVLLIQLTLTSSLYYIGETLRQRVMLDLIPSEHRNAIYSLIPTMVALIGFPLIPLTGTMIDLFNLNAGMLIALIINFIGVVCIFYSFRGKKLGNSNLSLKE